MNTKDISENAAQQLHVVAWQGKSGNLVYDLKSLPPSTRHMAKALVYAPEPQLCEDEGCPHYGTTHVCVDKLPAPAVPDNFHAAVAAYLAAIDRFDALNSTTGGGWSTKKVGTHQEIVLAANEMRERRKLLESLLQSTGGAK